jgi:hypothetical protein
MRHRKDCCGRIAVRLEKPISYGDFCATTRQANCPVCVEPWKAPLILAASLKLVETLVGGDEETDFYLEWLTSIKD